MPSSSSRSSVKTVDNFDRFSVASDGWDRRRSIPIVASSASTAQSFGSVSNGRRAINVSSPPQEKLVHRLRSNSGLSLHTNHSALRQYTDYNPDGSIRSSQYDPPEWQGDHPSNIDGAMTADYRGSMAFHSSGSGLPPAPVPAAAADFFSREVVQTALHDPPTLERLWQFARSRGGAENMEFLMKVQEYTAAVNQMVALMATISVTFTSVAATTPLRLPSQLSRSLNADVKHVSTSALPGLEVLFHDAKACVEQRIVNDVYPEFLKHQLSLCMKTKLEAERATPTTFNFDYPGLGDAFCLTDPYKADNPVVYASDGLASLTGFSRAEIVRRNCRFLQGPLTDANGVLHVRDAIARKEECVQLVLNYRKDGTPFWNLIYICPLKATNGKVRFYLGAQIDVSSAIRSEEDIMRILSLDSVAPKAVQQPQPPVTPDQAGSETNGSKRSRKLERGSSFRGRDRSTTPKPDRHSGISFFNPFRSPKQAQATPGSPKSAATVSSPPPSRGPSASSTSRPVSAILDGNKFADMQPSSIPMPIQVDDSRTAPAAYSRFLVLQFVPSSPLSQPHEYTAATTPYEAPTNSSVRLKVTFCARAALEILGLGPGAHEAVLYHDVFSVLADLAGSPTVITPVARGAILERLCGGDGASLELLVPAGGVGVFGGVAAAAAAAAGGRKGSIVGIASSEAGAGTGAGGEKQGANGGGRSRPPRTRGWSISRRSETFERRPEPANNMQRLMSHWTPLKDGDGSVAWVVLVFMPILG